MSLRVLIKKVQNKMLRSVKQFKQSIRKWKYQKEVNDLLISIEQKKQPLIIFFDIVDWNIPLFQRPQHMAKCLANKGYTYLFFTTNTYDDIKVFEQKEKNLYIINGVFKKKILEGLKQPDKYIQLYSTDMRTTVREVVEYKERGYKLIYEYIDEIAPELYGSDIPKSAREKHEYLIKDEETFIICTARKLYEEVLAKRGQHRLKLITNGVEYEHFRGRPTIGYFGAFANWFDYKLLEEVACTCKEYDFLLIGWEYDDSLSRSNLKHLENVKIIGPIEYRVLPQYAKLFDVAIIPFKINEITESTSPIKLFEYMALGKPIVTTDMPECRLYETVLIAKGAESFIDQLGKALALREDKEYLMKLNICALENTWKAKAEDLVDLIQHERE